jgi:hypothetical protein
MVKLASMKAEDDDFRLAGESDESLRSIARYSLTSLQLPVERLSVLEREWFVQRMASRERVKFCKHLQLLQNLEHERHPSTHFRTDPPRVCRCDKYGYKSAIENPDAEIVVAAFKKANCEGCPGREPKDRHEI